MQREMGDYMKLTVKKESKLLEYLYENLDMPKKRVKQYLSHGSIYVNNNKTTQFDYPLLTGMNIIINTENNSKKTLPFDILFEDNNILVVNKPTGLLTVATQKEKDKTLYHIVSNYLKATDKYARVYIIHRLDKDTSGIVVFAKNEKTKNIIQENWNDYASLREYAAVVEGHPRKKSDRIVQNLKETKTNLVYHSLKGEGKEAITNYEVVKENNKYSLLKIVIETGRKNQIRVALATINTPVLGDKKYGDKKSKEPRLFLHANRLKLYHPFLKKEILFETALPTEFKKIINK